jgi:hypothetical protein
MSRHITVTKNGRQMFNFSIKTKYKEKHKRENGGAEEGAKYLPVVSCTLPEKFAARAKLSKVANAENFP